MRDWQRNADAFDERIQSRIKRACFGGKGSAPAAPDYAGAAVAQGAANKDAAIASAQLSNPNIQGPYGSQTVSYANDPTTGNPVPTVTQSLSPEQQQLLSANQRVQLGLAGLGNQSLGTVQNVMGTPFKFNGPDIQTSLDTSNVAKMPVNAGTTAQDAIMSRLLPTQERQRAATETQLVNQGLRPGMEAYDNAIKDLAFQENDARQQAIANGIGIDMSANQQGYNQALQGGQFGNTAQQQAMAQQQQLYNLPLNQVTALMSGSQVTNPQFQGYQGQNVQAAPVFGAAQAQGQYDTNAFSNKTAANNAMMGGLASLGASGIGAYGMMNAAPLLAASDMRLKSNIVRVGDHPLGIGVYEYDIFGHRERGVMAQEVLSVKPEAVHQHPHGYLMVDYAAL